VLEAEIKPGQHQSQILHHGTGLLLDGIRQFAGRIGLFGRQKTGVNRCVAIVRYRRMFEDIRRKMNIEATQNKSNKSGEWKWSSGKREVKETCQNHSTRFPRSRSLSGLLKLQQQR
jgi:hypothetical protein